MTNNNPNDRAANEASSNRKQLHVIVIGSSTAVTRTICTLQNFGFAEISEWSPFSAGDKPGQVMKTSTQYIPQQ